MSVSSINSTTTAAQTTAAAANTRAADGDYKVKGAGHEVKDSDGDYAPQKVSSAAAPAVASSTLSALSSLKLGG